MPRGALRATGIIFSTLRSAPKAHAARLSAKSGWIVSLSKIALRANPFVASVRLAPQRKRDGHW